MSCASSPVESTRRSSPQGGLGPALKALARRSAVPVEVALHTAGRLPEPVEIAAYYVVSEALTNATKHAHATAITVTVEADAEAHVLRIAVRDDGVGGADFSHGTGLVGLKDRVEALSGRIVLDSTAGRRHQSARRAPDHCHERQRHLQLSVPAARDRPDNAPDQGVDKRALQILASALRRLEEGLRPPS